MDVIMNIGNDSLSSLDPSAPRNSLDGDDASDDGMFQLHFQGGQTLFVNGDIGVSLFQVIKSHASMNLFQLNIPMRLTERTRHLLIQFVNSYSAKKWSCGGAEKMSNQFIESKTVQEHFRNACEAERAFATQLDAEDAVRLAQIADHLACDPLLEITSVVLAIFARRMSQDELCRLFDLTKKK